MCQRDNQIQLRLKIPADLSWNGREKWKRVGIDACIAPLVKALQDGGIDMRGSCCGHGKREGHIDLADGRGLIVLSVKENKKYLSK